MESRFISELRWNSHPQEPLIEAEAYGSRTHQGPRRATPQPF